MSPGRPFAVVGASGAGKDTLIAAAARARPDLHIVRRVITRPETAGAEPYESVTEADFARREAAGAFALAWRAHGLAYGLPADMETVLAGGRDVLFNASRAALAQAAARFPDLAIIHVTARPETRAARLAARGREAPATLAARLDRGKPDIRGCGPVHDVANDGPLADAEAAFLAILTRETQ